MHKNKTNNNIIEITSRYNQNSSFLNVEISKKDPVNPPVKVV